MNDAARKERRAVRRRRDRDRSRQTRPRVEALEGRSLLSVGLKHPAAAWIADLPGTRDRSPRWDHARREDSARVAAPTSRTVSSAPETIRAAGDPTIVAQVAIQPDMALSTLLQTVNFTVSTSVSNFDSVDEGHVIQERSLNGNWVTVTPTSLQGTLPVTQRLAGVVWFRAVAAIRVDSDSDQDVMGEESPDSSDDPVILATSQPVAVQVQFPTPQTIAADPVVQAAANTAWANEKLLTFLNRGVQKPNGTFPNSRRAEIGFWILLNTGTGSYQFAGITLGAFNAPTQGAGIVLGFPPKDVPAPDGLSETYLVASFHTHTPTTYRAPYVIRERDPATGRVVRFRSDSRPVGPSTADDASDRFNNVAGLVYDYVADPATTLSHGGIPSIPFGWPLNAPARIYFSGPSNAPNRRM